MLHSFFNAISSYTSLFKKFFLKTKNLIMMACIIILIHTSCVVYHSPTADIPLISKKGEAKIDAGISLLSSANGTISYGLTNKIAVQTYGSIGRYLQGSVGHYKNLTNSRIIEIYGGAGFGHGNAYNDANPGNLYGDYQTYFAQVNYGKINSGSWHKDYGFGFKAGILHSKLTDNNYYDSNLPTVIHTYMDNSLLIEPNIFMRFGGQRLKFNVKLGGCWIYKFTNKDKYLPYSNATLGVSLNYRIGK